MFQTNSGELTKITEPHSSGSGSSPITTFAYDSRRPALAAHRCRWSCDNARLRHSLDTISSTSHNPDNNSWSLQPLLFDGLSDGSSNAQILLAADGNIGNLSSGPVSEVQASYTDANGYDWSYQTDAYGLETAEANPDNVVWQWQRRRQRLGQGIHPAGRLGRCASDIDSVVTTHATNTPTAI